MDSTFRWSSVFTILQVKQQLLDFQNFARMNQFAFLDYFFCQTFNVRFLIQRLHPNSTQYNTNAQKLTSNYTRALTLYVQLELKSSTLLKMFQLLLLCLPSYITA